jgi:CheY-like chemotaxis protein
VRGGVIKKILICDDVADNSFLLQTILETEDCYVEIANSGAEVLAKIETDLEQTDLLILDVMMPEIDGYEVARRIRQSDKFKSLPILLVTGLNGDEAIDDCGVQIEGVIQKPYDPDVITAQVLAILSK